MTLKDKGISKAYGGICSQTEEVIASPYRRCLTVVVLQAYLRSLSRSQPKFPKTDVQNVGPL